MRKETKMTNAKTNTFAAALANETRKLSNANKKRAVALSVLAAQARVEKFLKAAKVSDAIVSDLYLTEKVLKCADAMTREHATSADFNENTFCALKTAILNADTETFASDLLKASISNNFKVTDEQAKMMFRRKNLISATRQEQLNVKLIEVLNIAKRVSKTSMQINAKSYVLKLAQEKMSNMTI